jgi:hypothetical protein
MAAVNTQVLPQLEMARGMYIRVEGNTDALGDEEWNRALSEKRAQAIVDYLVTRGVDPRPHRGQGQRGRAAGGQQQDAQRGAPATGAPTSCSSPPGGWRSEPRATEGNFMQVRLDAPGLIRRAFFNQYNLILFGGALVFALALGSPMPAVVGLVGELLWLGLGATSPPFRRWVATRALDEELTAHAMETAQASRDLEPGYAGRVRNLSDAAADIRRMAIERGIAAALADGGREKLQTLVQSFIQMSGIHQRLSRFLADSQTAGIEAEIMRLGQSLTEEKDPTVRLSLRQALALGQRRLKQHEEIDGTRRALEVKMATLEGAFDYVRSQVFSGCAEAELAAGLDELVAGAGFVAEVEAEAGASLSADAGHFFHPHGRRTRGLRPLVWAWRAPDRARGPLRSRGREGLAGRLQALTGAARPGP